MTNADELEQLNQQIAALAACIAGHRDLIERLALAGKATGNLNLALAAMTAMFRIYIGRRQSLQAKNAGARPADIRREAA